VNIFFVLNFYHNTFSQTWNISNW